MVGKNACVPLKFTFSFACPNDFRRLQSFFPHPAPQIPDGFFRCPNGNGVLN